MNDISAREIVGFCDLRSTDRLRTSLLFHDFGTFESKFHPCISVNRIINTAVTRAEATEHLRVCGVDDRITAQRGDVALPKIDTVPYRKQFFEIGNSFLLDFFPQIGILHLQEFVTHRIGHPYIEKRTEQVFCICLSAGIAVFANPCCSQSNALIK